METQVVVKYECSICGSKLDHLVLEAFNPTVDEYYCPKCKLVKQIKRKVKIVTIVMRGEEVKDVK